MRNVLQKLFFVGMLAIYFQAPAQTELMTLKGYLSQNKEKLNLVQADFDDLLVTRSYLETGSNIRRIYAQQKVAGIDVQGGFFSLHTNIKTKQDIATNNLLPLHLLQREAANPSITAVAAATKALQTIQADASTLQLKQAGTSADQKTLFKRNDKNIWDVPTRLIYVLNNEKTALKLQWEVQVYEYTKQHYWVINIDAKTGKVVNKTDLVMHCAFGGGETDVNHNLHKHQLVVSNPKPAVVSPAKTFISPVLRGTAAANNQYRVYDMPFEAPTDLGATHSLITNPGNANASPDGWHKVANATTYNYTRGNNVWSFYDASPGPLGGVPNSATVAYDNGGPGGTPQVIEPFKFDYPINLNLQPDTYRNAAIVNLFYWNNLIHDVYYQFGFNENAANFQESHVFSTGIRGSKPQGQNDAVLAQAQDGGGTNNANFLTLPDGAPASAQMQMYLWTPSAPDSIVQITSSSTGTPPAGKKYFSIQGSFNTNNPDTNDLFNHPVLNRQYVLIQKNALSTVGTSSQGCATGQQGIALPPSNNVTNKIVLIDRGNCSFVEKVLGAQEGGAAGVIVINNVDGPPLTMGGSDATSAAINIPAVMISKADGDIIKAQLLAGANIIGSLKQNFPIPAKRDGDVDNGVIAHEYGHGISNRLTGGGDVLLPLGGSEQGGEGWSDFIALYLITRTNDLLPATGEHPNGVLPDKGIGTYVTYQNINTGGGIRPTRYSINKSVNPFLFKDIAKGGEISVPHGVGYIWCTMLYGLEQLLVDQYGFNDNVYLAANPDGTNAPAAGSGGNNIAMRLIVEGMKLQPINPTFEQQRNAILKADTLLYGARHSCKIWQAFADRGLGFSARSGSNALGDEQQSFDMPTSCDINQVRMNVTLTAPERINNNSLTPFTVNVKNLHTASVSNIVVSDSIPANTTLVSASDGGAMVGNKIVWNVATLAANTTKALNFTLSVNLPSATISLFYDNHEAGATNWAASPGTDTWVYQTNASNAYSGTKYWYAREVENPTHNVTLSMVNSVAIPAQGGKLSFYHKFNTEQGFDGGVIEISRDNGATWNYLPAAKFEKNGYNSIISTADNPNIGTSDLAAFSGATLGYINSVADLGDYAGQLIRVRFRYTCDVASLASGPNPGWYVDDVYLIRNLTEITNVATLAITGGSQRVFDTTGNTPRATATTIVFDNNPLPIQWSALAAVAQKNFIRLNWSTLTELRNAGFEIERKTENETIFTSIGFVNGVGNTSTKQDYVFNDTKVKTGIYYQYRLKQKDMDGQITYSNIALARLGTADTDIVFDILPNPARNNANLMISTPGRKNGLIKIYDAMGKPVTTFNAGSAFNSLQKYELNVANLAAGTYWVELLVDDVKMTKKLIITR